MNKNFMTTDKRKPAPNVGEVWTAADLQYTCCIAVSDAAGNFVWTNSGGAYLISSTRVMTPPIIECAECKRPITKSSAAWIHEDSKSIWCHETRPRAQPKK